MKKLLAESLQDFLNEDKEILKGEKNPGITADDVDPKEFLVGLAVESEHSSDLAVQKTITLQHLADNPKYYSEGMKKGLFEEPAAINIYKKYFIDKEESETVKESLDDDKLAKSIANIKKYTKNDYETLRKLYSISIKDKVDERILNAMKDQLNKISKES